MPLLIQNALLTLAAAFAVGWLFRRIGIPGGMMLGGIVGAAVFNVVFERSCMPYAARFFAQAVAGGFLGASIDREGVKSLPKLLLPLGVIVAGTFVSDLAIGFLITRLSPLDPITALSSGICGGINDVPLIAEELGGDAGKVAVLQFVRLITGIGLFPPVIRLVTGSKQGEDRLPEKERKQYSPKQVVLTLLAALFGGIIGKKLGIPAGTLCFAMVATAVLRLSTGIGQLPPGFKQSSQLLAGAYIGCMLGREDILELRYLLVPALVLVVIFALNCLISSSLICRFGGFRRKEALLATIPAGASEIALLSSELGASDQLAADIMLLHIFRVIAAVTFLPLLIPFFAKWL